MKTGIALIRAHWRASQSKRSYATNIGAPATGWTTPTATAISSARAHRWKATNRQRNDVSRWKAAAREETSATPAADLILHTTAQALIDDDLVCRHARNKSA